jgi:hypothetical protein
MMAFVDTFVCVHKEESWTHQTKHFKSKVSVRSVHLDKVWVGVEDGPKWAPTRVSTWGINGHFGASSR